MKTSPAERINESRPVKVLHFLNQFFGGVGGEDKADFPAKVVKGPVGPGKKLQAIFGDQALIEATMVCGDNFFHTHAEDVVEIWRALLIEHRPGLVVAGPCFDSGRYGLAAAGVCKATADLAIPAITGMHPDNPGAALIQKNPVIYIIPATQGVGGLQEILVNLCALGVKLANGLSVGSAAAGGYLPRGIRDNRLHDLPGSLRATAMLLRKIKGEPYTSEIPLPKIASIDPARPIQDLTHAKLALVTEGGLVRPGNPALLESARATKWLKYTVKGKDAILPKDLYSVHGGFDLTHVNNDPCRVLPLDAMSELERIGEFGQFHEEVYVTTGNATTIANASRFGDEIAQELRDAQVQGVVLTAT